MTRDSTARSARATKYQYVQAAIASDFGREAAGTPLPPESALCERYGVSRITVRRAIHELVQQGILTRQQGRGTFVCARDGDTSHPNELVDSRGLFTQMRDQGFHVSSSVLFQDVVVASARISQTLHVPAGSEVVRLDRLRSIEGRVDHLTRCWLDARKYRDLLTYDLADQSLQAVLSHDFAFTPRIGQATTRIVEVSGNDADHLGLVPTTIRLSTFMRIYGDAAHAEVCTETIYADAQASPTFTYISHSSAGKDQP